MAEAKAKKQTAPKASVSEKAPKSMIAKASKAPATTKTPNVEKISATHVENSPSIASSSTSRVAKTAKPTVIEKKKEFTGNTVIIKQVASGAGRKKNQIQTLKGLGLGKLNKQVELGDTPSIRGMIRTVSHLIKIVNEKV